MTYRAPVRDMLFTMKHVVGFDQLTGEGAFPDLSEELVATILSEAGKFAEEELVPLNAVGDRTGAVLENGIVRTAPGFKEAYTKFMETGWVSLPWPEEFGGQGMPHSVAAAVMEIWQAANISFGLCPLLSEGAIKALLVHGTDELRQTYLPKLISGEWTGSMNLTEPQAGSAVGALRTKAVPHGDGRYRITGPKIFITYGGHDMAENIIHLVLARSPDGSAGTRGISLFVVPKYLVNPDGSLGPRNDVQCLKLEEKMGIHASPTCVLEFGENDGAIGYLIGEENRGMACMFTKMNSARLGVGLQGLGVADHAYQTAFAYAQDRKQGKPINIDGVVPDASIIEHADVRRTLMTMRAMIDAARAICYATAVASDLSHMAPTEEGRADAKAREELLTPLAKAWSTDMSVKVASLGVQVHGGMGFIEETGAAQFYRDARITPIYEGTNGIQAIDLVTRKLTLNGGSTVSTLLAEIKENAATLSESLDASLAAIGRLLTEGVTVLNACLLHLHRQSKERPVDVFAGASPFLELFGTVCGAHYLALGAKAAVALIAEGGDGAAFYRARLTMTQFYAENILPTVFGYQHLVCNGADPLYQIDTALLAS